MPPPLWRADFALEHTHPEHKKISTWALQPETQQYGDQACEPLSARGILQEACQYDVLGEGPPRQNVL